MRRIIRVLAVAVLIAMILVSSMSPAMAGQQLSTEKPCEATRNAQNDQHGADLRMNPEGRAEGCWALLPYSEDR